MDTSSDLLLSISDEHATAPQLQSLTAELAADLRHQPGLRPSFPAESVPADVQTENGKTAYRGDPLAIGKLIIELLSSSAVGSLISVLRAYFERKPDLVFELKRRGDTLKITRKELHPGDEEEILAKIRSFLAE